MAQIFLRKSVIEMLQGSVMPAELRVVGSVRNVLGSLLIGGVYRLNDRRSLSFMLGVG